MSSMMMNNHNSASSTQHYHDDDDDDVELVTTSSQSPQQQPLFTDCPRWPRLFAAPIGCAILGVMLSPKFLVLGCVYGLTSLRPLYKCYLQSSSLKVTLSTTSSHKQQAASASVEAALRLHRSLTLQFAMLATCLWLYEHSRILCTAGNNNDNNDSNNAVVHRAFDMARHIVRWEGALGLAVEPRIQDFVLNHLSWVVVIANTYYAVMHFVVPLGVMARLIIYDKDRQYRYRVGFFIMLFLALLLFIWVPTMPPRLLPSYHAEYIQTGQVILSTKDANLLEPYWNIVDTMKQSDTIYDKLHKETGNPFAALPSMHTGWALWSCLAVLGTLDDGAADHNNARSNLLLRILAISHVLCIVTVIIVTGNHFWFDAVAGATCVLIGRLVAHHFINWLVESPCIAAMLLRLPLGSSSGSSPCGVGGNNSNKKMMEQGQDDYYYDGDELTQELTAANHTINNSSLVPEMLV